ncbi:unnamed protein product, partial [Adineta ricciae]
MLFFIQLIIFSCLFIKSISCDYIFCTSSCPQITVPFYEPTRLPRRCGDQKNTYHLALNCIIDYRIDYDAQNVYINFKATNDTLNFRDYNQSEFLTQSIWLGFNKESDQPNITNRQYGCNTRNDCARSYYLETIQRLIVGGKQLIDQIHEKLYRTRPFSSKDASQFCRDNTQKSNLTWTRCERGLCYAQNINRKQFCAKDNAPTLFSDMIYYFPRAPTEEREYI